MSIPDRAIRVLGVIPGTESALSMPFSRREMKAVCAHGAESHVFFLRSRTNPVAVLREAIRLRKTIREVRPDVVHAQFGTVTALVCVLISEVPVVITFQGQDLNPSPGISWIRSRLGRIFSQLAARRAAEIICVSPGLRNHLAAIANPVHVLPAGVQMNLFSPLSMEECRAKIGWKPDEKVAVINAGDNPLRKRVDIAQAAVLHAQKSIPNLRLFVFQGRIHPDEMPLYLNAADCLIMASECEGSPCVVKEALACNLPIVSVDVGDVVERLAGVTPSAIVPRDPIALGDKLVEIVRDGHRSNGREKVAELSEESIARKVVDVYRMAAASRQTTTGERRRAA
jgi:teichuronic acid biosynthesis glycosyltransferase TuaC